jgi:DNA-binding MarR family transcriptional regulator
MIQHMPASHTPRKTLPDTSPDIDIDTTARLRGVIGRLSRHLRPTAAAVAAGLTPTKISILLSVAREGPIRLSDLASAEGVNPTQLSRAIAYLVDAGLIERAADEGDRRAAWVKPTPAGRRLADRIRRERTDALNLALQDLDPQERAQIFAALDGLEHLAEQLKGARS